MKQYLLPVLFINSLFAYGQSSEELDSLDIDKRHRFQIYIAPGYSSNQFIETNASFAGIYLGIIYRDRVDVNISYSAILDNFRKQIIFPSNHKYDQKNFSVRGQFSFLSSKVRPHAGLAFSYCKAYWNPIDDSHDTFSNNFNMYEFFIGANWDVSDFFSLNGSIGYNKADGSELVGINKGDYDGFAFSIILKLKILKIL